MMQLAYSLLEQQRWPVIAAVQGEAGTSAPWRLLEECKAGEMGAGACCVR